jgi:hypothetical protein
MSLFTFAFMRTNYFHVLTLIIILVASVGCKNHNQNSIPNVSVQELVYLNTPEGFNLQVQGGWIYHNGGYLGANGLVVYRRYFNFQADDFVAYDRACPLDWQEGCGKLKVVTDIYLECECSGHKYLIFDGTPLDGNSPILRTYNTQFDGQNIIYIVN